MKKWIWSCSILLTTSIIVGNLYLYQKYNEKVYKVEKVHQFEQSKEGDIRISHIKRGVVTSLEEQVISYQQQLGTIDEILVSEGDEVTVGTELLRYSTSEYIELTDQLESKIDRAEAEITKIKSDILALKRVQFPTEFESEWEEAQAEANEALIDSQIRELEFQEELLEMDIEDYESQLNRVESQIDTKTIVSTSDGIVKSVSPNGQDEIMKIITYPYVIKGELTERDLEHIEVGQKVYIPQGEQPILGTISEISQFPIKAPSLHEETSYFPFSVTVTEEENPLLFAHHLEVEIVESESLQTQLLPSKTIVKGKKPFVYVLENGKVKKVEIEIGLENKGKTEVISGITNEHLIVSKPTKLKSDLPFVMPAKEVFGDFSQLKEIKKKKATAFVLRAMFAN
ncbi:efflux RND transporter periplasmic adaptor subunit [Bacillus pinisoli]|uniref:efflux RND transporter periplasmic adaptor subunit n=1 Tax=Bacillus pinisoli TaxID=2901866 RepID=UPI001FF69BC3|nr:efflux RND transporter periplasmic adaptor subunit [Bacillus pinisoli]